MSTAKKAVIERETFCLLEKGWAPNLMSFVAELLGPEGLRRAQPAATGSATPQVSTGHEFVRCFTIAKARQDVLSSTGNALDDLGD